MLPRRPSSFLLLPSSFFLILLLSLFLRLYRLDYQSFWNDEGNSARLAERSVRLIVEGAAGDIHPPGYYLTLKLWRGMLGESEWALRAFSAFAGVLTVALIIRLGREFLDRKAALFAGLFAAVHPFLIYYSQEARMYSVLAMLSCASFLLIVKRLRDTDGRRFTRIDSGWVLVTAAGLYTHYAFLFVILVEGVVVLLALLARLRAGDPPSRVARSFQSGTLPLGLSLLLFLPWLPTAYRQLITWPSAGERLSFFNSLAGIADWLTYGPFNRFVPLLALAACALLVLLGIFRSSRLTGNDTPRAGTRDLRFEIWNLPFGICHLPFATSHLPFVIWLFLPSLLILALGLFSDAFAKFLIVAVPPLCLLMGSGAGAMFRSAGKERALETRPPSNERGLRPLIWLFRQRSVTIGIMAVMFVAIGNGGILLHQYADPATFRDDYRGMARRIEANAREGDAVILDAPNQWEVFTYYHREGAPVYPLPRSRPLVVADTVRELESIARDHARLFVLYWGDGQADPDHVLEGWLNAHTFKIGEEWVGQVRFAQYAVPPDSSNYPTRTIGATFGDNFYLDRVALPADLTLRPGDVLTLTLFWSLDRSTSASYKVFLHLTTDSSQPPPVQQDSEPNGGLSPTTSWRPGETYPDNHGLLLPADLPPGEYQLLVGLYDPTDGRRLTLPDGSDALLLSALTVAP